MIVFQRRRDYALALVDVRTAELESSMRELSETQARLVFQERLAAIGQVAAAVGHELRNPLGVLTNTLYLVRSGLSDDEQARLGRHLDRADREIGVAVVIVESLLEFARARDPLDEPVDVADLVDESLSVAPPPDGVDVVQIGLDGIDPIHADRQQLRQVLLNLLTNSYQAMSGEGVVTIQAKRRGDALELRVSDTGTGMDEDTANHVFDAFFTRKAKGIGLGLAVTKRIVEAHGGTIFAESQLGVGTTFVVAIPAEPVAAEVRL